MSTPLIDKCALTNQPQRDDGGEMANVGYTGGQLNKWNVDYARNHCASVPESERSRSNLALAHVCGLLYKMCENSLPAPIIDDFERIIRENNLPRLDDGQLGVSASRQLGGSTGQVYSIELPSAIYKLTGQQWAPPSAVAAMDYFRCVLASLFPTLVQLTN
jgi:hypothetical protein